MIGCCAKPTPMIRSKLRSANARIAGSIAFGVPGSMSRKTIGRSFAARCTPCHAAALNERSSLPPISKTMPTLIFDLSSAADVPPHPERDSAVKRSKHAKAQRRKGKKEEKLCVFAPLREKYSSYFIRSQFPLLTAATALAGRRSGKQPGCVALLRLRRSSRRSRPHQSPHRREPDRLTSTRK